MCEEGAGVCEGARQRLGRGGRGRTQARGQASGLRAGGKRSNHLQEEQEEEQRLCPLHACHHAPLHTRASPHSAPARLARPEEALVREALLREGRGGVVAASAAQATQALPRRRLPRRWRWLAWDVSQQCTAFQAAVLRTPPWGQPSHLARSFGHAHHRMSAAVNDLL